MAKLPEVLPDVEAWLSERFSDGREEVYRDELAAFLDERNALSLADRIESLLIDRAMVESYAQGFVILPAAYRERHAEPLTPLQRNIMKALNGRGLTSQPLADEVAGSDKSRLFKPGGIKELTADGRVKNKRQVGYYRPDAPPK